MHVVDAPGARGPGGQDAAGVPPVPEKAVSPTDTLFSVTLPVFVTKNEYVTVSPAWFTTVGDADFTNDTDGAGVTVTTALDGVETTGVVLFGGVP